MESWVEVINHDDDVRAVSREALGAQHSINSPTLRGSAAVALNVLASTGILQLCTDSTAATLRPLTLSVLHVRLDCREANCVFEVGLRTRAQADFTAELFRLYLSSVFSIQ